MNEAFTSLLWWLPVALALVCAKRTFVHHPLKTLSKLDYSWYSIDFRLDQINVFTCGHFGQSVWSMGQFVNTIMHTDKPHICIYNIHVDCWSHVCDLKIYHDHWLVSIKLQHSPVMSHIASTWLCLVWTDGHTSPEVMHTFNLPSSDLYPLNDLYLWGRSLRML